MEENKIMEVVNEEVVLEEVSKSGMSLGTKVGIGALIVAAITAGVIVYRKKKKSKELVDVTPEEEIVNDENDIQE